MSLKVIGAGLGRTGTLTLKLALEELGFGPCHHMVEVFAHPEQMAFWRRAADGAPVDWEEIYAGYPATVDWPSAHFYKQLADRYPDAKVILSTRDPKRWFDSMSETILKVMTQTERERGDPAAASRFAEIIVAEQTFGLDFSEANVIAAFERHNAEVRRTIAPERLLEFEAAHGWEPLCAFLRVPEPMTPFPRTNSREEFWSHLPAPGGPATLTS